MYRTQWSSWDLNEVSNCFSGLLKFSSNAIFSCRFVCYCQWTINTIKQLPGLCEGHLSTHLSLKPIQQLVFNLTTKAPLPNLGLFPYGLISNDQIHNYVFLPTHRLVIGDGDSGESSETGFLHIYLIRGTPLFSLFLGRLLAAAQQQFSRLLLWREVKGRFNGLVISPTLRA